MRRAIRFALRLSAVAAGVLTVACSSESRSTVGGEGIAIDSDDIGGVVRSEQGPEAGVWVIAETDEFKTRFARIVVTDDQGRFVVPDLPPAKYSVWVRGYGLVDSEKVTARPGDTIELAAKIAPDDATAAQVYPAAYWYAMMRLPKEDEVEHLGGGRNEYLMWMKNMGCIG